MHTHLPFRRVSLNRFLSIFFYSPSVHHIDECHVNPLNMSACVCVCLYVCTYLNRAIHIESGRQKLCIFTIANTIHCKKTSREWTFSCLSFFIYPFISVTFTIQIDYIFIDVLQINDLIVWRWMRLCFSPFVQCDSNAVWMWQNYVREKWIYIYMRIPVWIVHSFVY